ncbi:DUF3106 domain-containing protein [Mesosutterella sp. AGMB02718]|uniref:DUF3106 domain-containing protein n=1 Tax=Mesosutterella faecium TaxID=2925194 RepID=A0ABT7IJ41_9BURK|nr:DUF3106 domain-containing protein [Mesosutterella sp. AGMB02718]MDL2058392.1 DUF3106 domain-containing protein [Mesosutterella sp. AGMB02718]
MKKSLFIAALAATLASCATLAQEAPACNRSCTAAEWSGLSLQERADIWPAMSREARKRLWSYMTEGERQELRDKLRPIRRDQIRRRYDCMVVPAGGPAEFDSLSPKERRYLRRQIMEVHMEYQHHGLFPHDRPASGPGPAGRP